jgi:hypothetical protein
MDARKRAFTGFPLVTLFIATRMPLIDPHRYVGNAARRLIQNTPTRATFS